MSFTVYATLTNTAKFRYADVGVTGKSFTVTHFAVDSAGHDLGDPETALTPNPADVVCPGSPPIFGPHPIDAKSIVSAYCDQYQCVLEESEAVASISNICLIATIIFSPIPDDPEVGSTFLYAVGNMPLRVKFSGERHIYNVLAQF